MAGLLFIESDTLPSDSIRFIHSELYPPKSLSPPPSGLATSDPLLRIQKSSQGCVEEFVGAEPVFPSNDVGPSHNLNRVLNAVKTNPSLRDEVAPSGLVSSAVRQTMTPPPSELTPVPAQSLALHYSGRPRSPFP